LKLSSSLTSYLGTNLGLGMKRLKRPGRLGTGAFGGASLGNTKSWAVAAAAKAAARHERKKSRRHVAAAAAAGEAFLVSLINFIAEMRVNAVSL